jgi:Uma2 family endonuclease
VVAVPEQVMRRRLTLEDYLALPDDQRYEIVEGVLHVAPRPRPLHQVLVHRFQTGLEQHVGPRGLGQLVPDADLIIGEREVYVAPDLMFFAGDRYSQVDPEDFIRIVPDLVVEVLSPSTEDYDERTKRRVYAELGVPHYWRVHPQRRLVVEGVLRQSGEAGQPAQYEERIWRADETFTPSLFPGLQLHLSQLFQ